MSRVTQSMINAQLLRNLNTNMLRQETLQNQIATLKRINKPSDDPVGISFAMRYRNELAANEQYQSNVDTAISWLENLDTTLGQAGEVMQRLRVLVNQAANGTNPETAMNAIKEETHQLYEQLIDIGNTKFNGKYIFNGQMTDTPPYGDPSNILVDTDTGSIRFEIGIGVQMAVNVGGSELFGSASADDHAFKIFDEVIGMLEDSDFDGLSNVIDKIDVRFEEMLKVRSEAGAKVNRLELAEERLKDANHNLNVLQSKTENVDLAEAITKLKMAESIYDASLSVGARIIRPSLIDFLR